MYRTCDGRQVQLISNKVSKFLIKRSKKKVVIYKKYVRHVMDRARCAIKSEYCTVSDRYR